MIRWILSAPACTSCLLAAGSFTLIRRVLTYSQLRGSPLIGRSGFVEAAEWLALTTPAQLPPFEGEQNRSIIATWLRLASWPVWGVGDSLVAVLVSTGSTSQGFDAERVTPMVSLSIDYLSLQHLDATVHDDIYTYMHELYCCIGCTCLLMNLLCFSVSTWVLSTQAYSSLSSWQPTWR